MKRPKPQLIGAGILLALVSVCLYRYLGTSRALPAPPIWSVTNAQARLPTVKLWLGSQELVAEVARKPVELATGMMFRTNFAFHEAMLFLLPVRQRANFYMRNTLIPLSCAYIDDEGTILEIHDMQPKNETPILSADANVRFVLEVNRGWFETNHIGVGTLLRTERGALSTLLRTPR
jgi:uncharacterized protein